MNDGYIVTVYVVIREILEGMRYEDDRRAQMSAAEIMTVAVVSAKYFQNHHERALYVLARMGYVKPFSMSRFNRCLHKLRDWLYGIVTAMGDLFAGSSVFLIDRMPMPVCKRKRAGRCKKVRGRAFCGYCVAKGEKFFGWRLHLVCTAEGIPVSFDLLPASEHDLTPIHELLVGLSAGATVFGDKGYISQSDALSLAEATHVRLVSIRRENMQPLSWADDFDLRLYRKRIETLYSQLESMGLQRLHARTRDGFDLKTFASLLALLFTNAFAY